MMERRKLIIWAVVLVVVTSIITAGAVIFFTGAGDQLPGSGAGEGRIPELAKLERVLREIQNRYINDVDTTKLINAAITGMVSVLEDPYSMYMDNTHYGEMMIHTQGSFGGIGITVGIKEDKYLTVIAPMKGTPGANAGIRAGDKIIKVDGRDIVGMPLDEAVRLMRGPEGTKVTLTILRADQKEPIEITITRAIIEMPNVEWRVMEEGIGYIKLYTFNEITVRRLKSALAGLRKARVKGIILDLRHNPGGRLDSAVEVAEMFVPKGPIVYVVDNSGNRQVFQSNSRGLSMPLVVMVDGGSASASEIVAGAVQDRGSGILLGTRTFGKGSVQSVIDLGDGTGLKLTTAQYLTPNGRAIDEKGLEPDVVLEGDEEVQLRKAVEVLRSKIAETQLSGALISSWG